MPRPPFLPYARQTVDRSDIDAVVAVLESDHLTTGPAVSAFEQALAIAVGADWGVSVTSGTAALHAACFAAGVADGDEVIVPAVGFVADANCARYLGAEPVFVDVDPNTGLIAPGAVSDRLRDRTRAIIPVHLTGRSADIDALRGTATSDITIIEDAAHALGAMRGAEPVGSCHDGASMTIFSFHPVKHITTGEGGMITGNDPDLRRRLELFRNHGVTRAPDELSSEPGPWYYEQLLLGHNLRLTDLQAALGHSQLRKLDLFVTRRREIAARYDDLLREIPGVSPVVPERARAESAFHLYSVLIEFDELGRSRSDTMNALRDLGIGTQVHYIPIPIQPYYRARGWHPEDFPGAMRYYARTLSLPMFPAMSDTDVDRVVEALHDLLTGRAT